MSNPLREMIQYEETVSRESKAVQKWQDRYGHPEPRPNAISHNCSIAVVVMGHPLLEDGTLDPILEARLERGTHHWSQCPTSTVMVLTGADTSMYPDAQQGVVQAMHDALVKKYNVPAEVIYSRPEGLSTFEQADDVARWLGSPLGDANKAACSLLKLVTSDFNIVRAKRCFRKVFSIYISEDEVPSGMRGEDFLFQLDREHHLVREYRLAGLL
eukprot:TRINITY_DN9487_c0_g1_i1.p1 TRINITY_DN9487_c0_g1~~TRINITY_DN9487_c0_g1_i1.p1  ORF type:complete len:214 (+),score=35.75 TRINITY_DN9487_c0_g1_i1:233-874(+)